jgi:DNA polymerase III subunit epsilon
VRSAAAAAYRAARLPARGTPWRKARFCVVDLELTGLDRRRDAIVAWAAIPVDDGRVTLGGAREGLVRPPGTVPAESIRVHGLRELDLAGAPGPDEAADALLEALAGRVLVAHAAEVERAFLGPLLRSRGARLRGPVVDTRLLGRLWLAERGDHAPARLSLPALTEALGLPAHRPHRAAGDALTTAQAFIALASLLGDETVRSLAGAQHRLEARKIWA